MLLFEFDQGQLHAARVGSGQGDCPDPEVMSALRDSILQIVGRPLFPVRWNDSGHGGFDGPDRLVAMDPSGQVVSVEVVPELTSAGLVEALARSGRTASLGWVDLSEAYPRGAPAFRSDWNEFRGGMPPRPLPGPRLYVVTGEVREEVRPALEMLADSGIEVYEARQRSLSTGRVIVEIEEPYRVSIPTIGPTVARLAGRRPDLLEDSEEMSRLLEIAPDGDQLEADIASVPGALSHPVPPRRGRRAAPGPVDAIPVRESAASAATPVVASAPETDSAAEEGSAGSADSPSAPSPDTQTIPVVTAPVTTSAEHAGEVPPSIVPASPAVADEPASPIAIPPQGAASAPRPTVPTPADAPAGQAGAQPGQPAAQPEPSSAPTAAVPPRDSWRNPRVDPALATLGQSLGQDARLAWVQLRRGIRHEITLRPDGLLITDDGREFSDPSEAARALTGRHQADGWRVWRLPDGRPLKDAIEGSR